MGAIYFLEKLKRKNCVLLLYKDGIKKIKLTMFKICNAIINVIYILDLWILNLNLYT